MPTLILASSSPYRRELLQRLTQEFTCQSPALNESPLVNEDAEALVRRLAEAKARAIADAGCSGLIIGSDQAAVMDGKIIGKPGNHEVAVQQLSNASGKKVLFLTGLCLLNSDTGNAQTSEDIISVEFRKLSASQIDNYLQREKPYDCAGSFKSEGLGISLFEKMEGDDPNALIGLPMITLINMLSVEGVDVLEN